MVQAIFLPGAWGKIPVFMGKNHPTPRGCYGFFHAQNYPPKTGLFRKFAKWIKFLLTTFDIKAYNGIKPKGKRAKVHYQKGDL